MVTFVEFLSVVIVCMSVVLIIGTIYALIKEYGERKYRAGKIDAFMEYYDRLEKNRIELERFIEANSHYPKD